MKKIESEAEFGKDIVKILHKLGFETWQEVYLNRKYRSNTHCADIISRLGYLYFAFELKLQLNDEVLNQARINQSFVHYSYVVVPPRTKKSISHVKDFYLKNHGIGLILIEPVKFLKTLDNLLTSDSVKQIRKSLLRKGRINNLRKWWLLEEGFKVHCKAVNKRVVDCKSFLFEDQKKCAAGSISGNTITPFKRSCKLIYEYLQQHPKASKKEVWEVLHEKLHWSNYNSMCGSFRTFKHLEIIKKIIWQK